MICPNCGNTVEDGNVFCMHCGARLVRQQPNTSGSPIRTAPSREMPPNGMPRYQPTQPVQPIVIQQREITEDQLPARFRPLGAWAYFGYGLLFAIPIVGFIFLIIFSCSSANINRRNYARSYWCVLVLAAIIFGIVLLIAAATGGIASLFDW
jgi:hypothetical protein